MNIEARVIEFLNSELEECEVFGDVPQTRPEMFVTVELTGGVAQFFKREAQLAIQCWAKTRFDASELALETQDALWSFVDEPQIMRVEQNHPYNYPDEGVSARYQFVATITTA